MSLTWLGIPSRWQKSNIDWDKEITRGQELIYRALGNTPIADLEDGETYVVADVENVPPGDTFTGTQKIWRAQSMPLELDVDQDSRMRCTRWPSYLYAPIDGTETGFFYYVTRVDADRIPLSAGSVNANRSEVIDLTAAPSGTYHFALPDLRPGRRFGSSARIRGDLRHQRL
jgi:hypothetical protein